MDSQEKVIDKIQKLLALAEDKSSASESQAAMLKAQKLMAKHSLTAADVNSHLDVESKVIIRPMQEYKRLPWWHKCLAFIIAKNFKCRSITTRSHKFQLSYIQFVGHPEDIEICASVYDFAVRQITFFAEYYNKKWKHQIGYRGVSVKNDYIAGYLKGMEAKFKEQVDKNQWGLIVVCDKSVNDAFEHKINTHAKSHVNAQFLGDPQAISDGFADGKRFMPTNGAIERE